MGTIIILEGEVYAVDVWVQDMDRCVGVVLREIGGWRCVCKGEIAW